jgi:hypothetical protein
MNEARSTWSRESKVVFTRESHLYQYTVELNRFEPLEQSTQRFPKISAPKCVVP